MINIIFTSAAKSCILFVKNNAKGGIKIEKALMWDNIACSCAGAMYGVREYGAGRL